MLESVQPVSLRNNQGFCFLSSWSWMHAFSNVRVRLALLLVPRYISKVILIAILEVTLQRWLVMFHSSTGSETNKTEDRWSYPAGPYHSAMI